MNQESQKEALTDAHQTKQVLYMVSKMPTDLTDVIRSLRSKSQDLYSQIEKDSPPDTKIKLTLPKVFDEGIVKEKERLTSAMRKYGVNPQWLKRQQTKHLEALMNKEQEKVLEAARKAEKTLLMQESDNIVNLINKKAPNDEVKKTILSKIRSTQAVNQSTFDALAAENLESLIQQRNLSLIHI